MLTIHPDHQLLNDQSVADMLDVSLAWVRMQKYNRKYGKEHTFNIDPVLMGKIRRYRKSDVLKWIERQEIAKPVI